MSPPRRVDPDESKYSGRVAKRIRELRESRKLTAADMVEKMAMYGFNVTRAAYTHWETGRGKVQWDALPALAKALGVKIRDLIPTE